MDYKALHLQWILRHPNFLPQGDHYDDYHLVMDTLYRKPNVTQNLAQMFFESDRKCLLKYDQFIKELNKQDLKEINSETNKYFITIGFNHQTWDIPSCVKVIETIIGFDWVKTAEARFELFRENGRHPHVHFLIDPTHQIPKSKVLEKIWATKGIKKVCLKKSFIDFKIAADYHSDYIKLLKKDSKMQYVKEDIEWRDQNKIPQVFEKNNL